MQSAYFTYHKGKVIQALRYHFISRKEIKLMMIFVNVFAILAAALFYFKVIGAFPFMISSLLWFFLMFLFWFLLPTVIYRKNGTFKDTFKATLGNEQFAIENARGSRSWDWKEFSTFMESPHFYHLYFNARAFFIVPKDAFEGDDVHEARRLLSTKIIKK